jgi:hypothetical protein
MTGRKKYQCSASVIGLFMYFLPVSPAAALSCVTFPPNTNLPLQSSDGAVILSALGATGPISTNQHGDVELGDLSVSIRLNAAFEKVIFSFRTSNSSRQVTVSFFKNGQQLGPPSNVVVMGNVPLPVTMPTNGADQVVIAAVVKTNDTSLGLACGE